MQSDFNPDNLDRFFKKQLSETERNDIEKMMAQDPLLKSEIHFQQEVVEAICQHRKWELKNRLNALAPESSPLFTIPRVAFGSTLTLAGLLTATLFWFDSKKSTQTPQTKAQPIVQYIKQKPAQAPNLTQTATKPIQIEITPTKAEPISIVRTAYVAMHETAAAPITEQPCLPARMEAFIEDTELALQEATIKMYDENLLFEISNTDTDNGAFDRHSEDEHNLERMATSQLLRYQYYNEHLSLYNNASAGKQIHAIVQGELRHFLYYDNVYYEFFDEQVTEIIMQPVRDKNAITLIKEILIQMESLK